MARPGAETAVMKKECRFFVSHGHESVICLENQATAKEGAGMDVMDIVDRMDRMGEEDQRDMRP